MSNEMRLTETFTKAVKCSQFGAEAEVGDSTSLFASLIERETNKASELEAYGVSITNKHARLSKENKLLREALEKSLRVVNRAAAMDDSEAKSVRKEVRKLLLELGGE